MITRIKHLAEYLAIIAISSLFRAIGLHKASNLGSWIACKIGPLLKPNKTAKKNLKRIFPEKSENEIDEICLKMWDNLGRLAAESVFISKLSDEEFEKLLIYKNKLDPKLSCIYLGGHFGNFEIASRLCGIFKIKVHFIYRYANNPYVDKLIINQRKSEYIKVHRKGKAGLKAIIKVAESGTENIGMLFDQKTNNGITVPFLGHDAKTTPLPATLAKKYGLPIVVGFMKRKKGATFEVYHTKPMYFKRSESTKDIMTKLNGILGEEIKKCPEQWFWVHNRWK